MPSPPIGSARGPVLGADDVAQVVANDAASASAARARRPGDQPDTCPQQAREAGTSPRSRVLASLATGSSPSRWKGKRCRGHPTHVGHPSRGRQRELEGSAAQRGGDVPSESHLPRHRRSGTTPVWPGEAPTRTGQDEGHDLRGSPRPVRRRPGTTALRAAAGSGSPRCRSASGRTSATTGPRRPSARSCGGPSTAGSPTSTSPTTTARRTAARRRTSGASCARTSRRTATSW